MRKETKNLEDSSLINCTVAQIFSKVAKGEGVDMW